MNGAYAAQKKRGQLPNADPADALRVILYC